jgi:hypothetical protein
LCLLFDETLRSGLPTSFSGGLNDFFHGCYLQQEPVHVFAAIIRCFEIMWAEKEREDENLNQRPNSERYGTYGL